jgi:alpha-methylacyl-CoA racemase
MGPLKGMKIVEMEAIGPGPFCAMLLADMGATVLRIERKQPSDLGLKRPPRFNLLLRGRQAIALDLKDPRGVETALRLIEQADGLIEGFRPGVMERLGLGPDVCLKRNSRLAYGRMTGWGQEGPLAQTAGHDLGYIAITGILDAIGRHGAPPSVPLNLIGDYGGGGVYLALGLLAAILEARQSGRGQVVDAAIVDGAASLATTFFGMAAAGMLRPERGSNATDSGSHFYDVYQCADGKWISVAALEGKFYAEFLRRLGIDSALLGPQMSSDHWPAAKILVAARIKEKTRDEWARVFSDGDACVAPVLSWIEAAQHPHISARQTLIEIDGIVQPAPAPRFSRTACETPSPPAPAQSATAATALGGWLGETDIRALQSSGII